MSLLQRIQALSSELRAQHDTQAITDALNADTTATEVVEYWLTDRGMVSDLVVATGDSAMSDSILTKLDGVAAASRSAEAIVGRLYNDAKGLNFGDAAMRAWFVSQTLAGTFTQAECDAVLALAVRKAVVDEYTVRCLCWSDDGQWLV